MSLDWSDIKDRAGHPTPGGAGWYRCAIPAKYLAQNGIQTVYGPNVRAKRDGHFVVVDWDQVEHDDLDVIVIQRWMQANAAPAIKRAVASGQVIVNDVDDHYDGLATSNRAWLATHPKLFPDNNRNLYKEALAASSALTVSTRFLVPKMERFGKPVFHVPNMLDLERWDVQDVSGPPVVGWVGVTAFRSGDLESLKGILEPWMLRHPEVGFHHSGYHQKLPGVDAALGLSRPISVTPMDNILKYPAMFEHFNIGIVPLTLNNFNEAKSSIKGIEYSACGIPTIASPTKEYERLRARNACRIAHKAKQWQAHLDVLLDPKERIKSGRIARSAVEQHYDVEKNWQNWSKVYEELVGH